MTPGALQVAAVELRRTSSDARELGDRLRVAQQGAEVANGELVRTAVQLRSTPPTELAAVRLLERQRDEAVLWHRASVRSIDEVEERWEQSCRAAVPVLEGSIHCLGRVTDPGPGAGVGQLLRTGGRLGYSLFLAPFWPFERDTGWRTRAKRVVGLSTTTAEKVSGYVASYAMRYAPGSWDRTAHFLRRGHERKLVWGKTTWVKSHLVRNHHARWTPPHLRPDEAERAAFHKRSSSLAKAGKVLAIGVAAHDQYRRDALDGSMETSERIGRAATAGAVVGGASIAGGMVGAKGGAVAGAKAVTGWFRGG
ncbi:MAG: hypothetical protein JJT89_11810 [Nitriliruptoraceae bacterium]|nr:hypothetical protein [Nitriliruptoraceae bacterium]